MIVMKEIKVQFTTFFSRIRSKVSSKCTSLHGRTERSSFSTAVCFDTCSKADPVFAAHYARS